MSPESQKSLRENILAAIESGKVQMRPRWHFVARTGLFIVGMILAVFSLLYVASLIIFLLHQNGTWFVPGFGLRGIQVFLTSLPLVLILFAALFLIILQVLVRRYAFGYGRPLLYSTLGILGLTLIGGFVIARTPLHRTLYWRAQDDRLPFGRFYRAPGRPGPDQVVAGKIVTVTDEGYEILTPLEENLTVIITPETRFPLGMNFEAGDVIVILGDRDDDSIRAFGIREVPDEMMFAPRPGMRVKVRNYQMP